MTFLSQGVLLSSLWPNPSCLFGDRVSVFTDTLWSIHYQFHLLHAYASYQFVSYLCLCRIFFLSVEELVLEKKKHLGKM